MINNFNDFNDLAKDSLDEWIYFLKNEEIKDNFKAKGLEKAKEVLDYLKCSDAEKREYKNFKESLHDQASMYESTYVVGHMDGEKKGKIDGKIEGKMERDLEIAKTMLTKGFDVHAIMEIIGLDKETVLILGKTA